MNGYTFVIIATLIGFFLLAFLLLVPVYAFLEREQRASEEWTPEKIAERLRTRRAATDGAATTEKPPEATAEDA